MKKKRNNDYHDLITVFAMFAILALTCIACALIGKNPEFVQRVIGRSGYVRDYEEAKKQSRIIIMVIGIIALIIMALFIRSIIKHRKKIALERAEKERKQLELEAAKMRVQAARMEEFVRAGRSEIDNRKALRRYSLDEEGLKEDRKWASLDDEAEIAEYEKRIMERRRGIRLGELDNEGFAEPEGDAYIGRRPGILMRIKRFFKKIRNWF